MVSESTDSIESLIRRGRDQAVEEKSGLVVFTFSEQSILNGLYRDAKRAIVRSMSRPHGETDEEPWVKIKRSRFFPESISRVLREPDLKTRCGGLVLRSGLWVPRMHAFAGRVQCAVRESGRKHGIDPWAEWTVSRIGSNYANGSDRFPAKIGRHSDVKNEHGLVVATEIHEGELTHRYTPSNNISLIIGADVCRQWNIEQSPHGGEPISVKRLSLTLADLRQEA